MKIREAVAADWNRIYPIFAEITAAGTTYAYPAGLSSDDARELWMSAHRVVVAEDHGQVLGTATMGPNRPGNGAHIATASFMVSGSARGLGVGRALGEHMLEWASENGHRGVQFNAVVASNTAAVKLWRSLGFEVVGTVPGAFRHPELGYVDLLVMFRSLV